MKAYPNAESLSLRDILNCVDADVNMLYYTAFSAPSLAFLMGWTENRREKFGYKLHVSPIVAEELRLLFGYNVCIFPNVAEELRLFFGYKPHYFQM